MKLQQSVYYDYMHACTHYGKLALSDLKFDTYVCTKKPLIF